MSTQKIRIRLKAYDHKSLDQSAQRIVDTARKTGADVSGPIPLPTEKEIITILRAVHKYKDSREQFRTAHAQAPHRHPEPDAQDDRCSHEAGYAGRCRHRDKTVGAGKQSVTDGLSMITHRNPL
jgi:hypothetical protein